MMAWTNAKITSTLLGPESHGIFTCYLTLDSASYTNSFGGYDLRGPWGWQFIEKILSTVGVETWEQLPGDHVDSGYAAEKWTQRGHQWTAVVVATFLSALSDAIKALA